MGKGLLIYKVMRVVNPDTSNTQIKKWFKKERFQRLKFKSNPEYISTFWLNQSVTFKLNRRPGHDTYYREAYGGSLIVFEVSVLDGNVAYNGYCPLLLFGFWNLKLSFKKNAGFIFKYRKQGYEVQQRFEAFLAKLREE